MSEPDLVHGVLLAHGKMAEGLVDAVERISGVEDAVIAISNQGLSPEALRDRLQETVGDHRTVIFTDMASGSCGMAAAVACRSEGRRAVVCGVNLPILLDFVFHRELPLAELVPRLLEKGRESVRGNS